VGAEGGEQQEDKADEVHGDEERGEGSQKLLIINNFTTPQPSINRLVLIFST